MRKLSTWIVILAFLIVNVVFNASLWQKLWLSHNSQDIYSSDSTITELLTETSYTNLLAGKNPFAPTDKLFYPFGMDFAMNDPGTVYVIPFLFFRPFLTIYQSMLLSVLFFMFAASIAMYALLKHLKHRTSVALLFSLVFSYMPFISHRLQGHYTYLVHFLFPLVYLLLHVFLFTKDRYKKISATILIPLTFALTLYANFYYLIFITISLAFYLLWYLIFHRELFWRWVRTNLLYLLPMGILFFLAISPWILAVRDIVLFDGIVSIPGFGGAMQYSADLFSFFVPNQYNYFYLGAIHFLGSMSPLLSRFEQYFLHSWEVFAYPGVILLTVYGWIIIRLKKHTFPQQLWHSIRIPFFASSVFAIFSLGPFLKIANIWHVNLEGIEVMFPLPFLLLRSLPGLGGLRVPTRFTPGFVFFACLVGAYLLTYLLRQMSPRKQRVTIVSLLAIFVIDQHYFVPVHTDSPIPTTIYSYIKEQGTDTTVMEIPLTVRDGFQYKGFVHAISPMQGVMMHGHPILGGYFARVGQPIFDYYDNLPYVGYMLDITDRGNYNPTYQQPKDPVIYPFTIPVEQAQAELNFLNVEYVIAKNDEPYSSQVRLVLTELGLTPVMEDRSYTLFRRNIKESPQHSVQLGSDLDYLSIGRGLSPGELGSQVMVAARAQLFLSVNNTPASYTTLHVAAASTGSTTVEVFINRQAVGEITVSSTPQQFRLNVENSLIPHINSIMFRRSKTSDPVSFTYVGLE